MRKVTVALTGLGSALAVSSLALSFGFAATPAAPPPARPAAAPVVNVPPGVAARPQGYADLAERLLPMVVNISTSQTLKRPAGAENAPAPQAPQGSPLD